jgi:predicted amidohydrolase
VRDLRLALLQRATAWHDPEGNRRALEASLAELPRGLDVVLLPEMFTTGFTMASETQGEAHPGPTLTWLKAQAARLDAAVGGSVAVQAEGQGARNRFYFVTPEGEVTFYDKRHLFRMAGEHEHYAPGTERVVVPWRGWRLALQVCYDLRFPVFMRNRGDYDALLVVANWPAPRQEQWRALLPARAIENQCWLAAVNIVGEDGTGKAYRGGSTIIDCLGQRHGELLESPGVLLGTFSAAQLAAQRAAFPVAQDADDFELGSPRLQP